MRSVLTGIVLTAMITPALAADPVSSDQILSPEPIADEDDYIFWLGGGIAAAPDYEGSDDYEATFFPIIDPVRFFIPRIGTIGGESRGFSIRPSFGAIGDRDQSDNPALVGLGDVDFSVELGAEVEYRTDYWRVFANARYGVSGHNGLVGTLGADGIFHPMDDLTIVAGPRLNFANEDFFDTYYSVNATQAAASAAGGIGLPVFDADAGLRSYGVEAEAIYQFAENWRAHLRAAYFHLAGDAADSPIVAAAGDENQGYVGLGFSRRFAFDID